MFASQVILDKACQVDNTNYSSVIFDCWPYFLSNWSPTQEVLTYTYILIHFHYLFILQFQSFRSDVEVFETLGVDVK